MKKKNLIVFANFLIDSYERFQRLKDSYNSFKNSNIDSWVINIRGSYKKEVRLFLLKNISKKRILIFDLDSGDWFNDVKVMLNVINSKLVFIWIEDHICLKNSRYFNEIINEMLRKKIDYLQYSFFLFGLPLKSLSNINFKQSKNLIYFYYTNSLLKKRLNWFDVHHHQNLLEYIISLTSIMKTNLFKKIILSNEFTFFSKNNPFAFEKNTKQTQWLPYKLAITKNEFFAAIDSDQHTVGYSLISRGLYKKKKTQKMMNQIREKNTGSIYNFYGKIYFSKYLQLIKELIKIVLRYLKMRKYV